METLAEAWASLRGHLENRSRELNDEVAHYPTPIARCDVQLTKLLEQRARLRSALSRANQVDSLALADGGPAWRQGVEIFLSEPQADTDDDGEARLRARLRAALACVESAGTR